MAPAMKAKKVATKAMKGQKVMTKGALLGELANATEMKKADISKVLNSLTEIGTEEVKKSGKFVLPGLCMIKTRTKAAVKGGGTRMMFGKVCRCVADSLGFDFLYSVYSFFCCDLRST